MHGSRTSTIAHVLASSPVALFCWISEKFLEWSDDKPTLDQILDSITYLSLFLRFVLRSFSLYWVTQTYERCIYPYREVACFLVADELLKCK